MRWAMEGPTLGRSSSSALVAVLMLMRWVRLGALAGAPGTGAAGVGPDVGAGSGEAGAGGVGAGEIGCDGAAGCMGAGCAAGRVGAGGAAMGCWSTRTAGVTVPRGVRARTADQVRPAPQAAERAMTAAHLAGPCVLDNAWEAPPMGRELTVAALGQATGARGKAIADSK